jgi:dTDP-D-glucose 4,6-dehydratase
MTDLDIQKSQHLLKSLNEEMSLLSNLTAQITSLANQAHYVSSNIRGTWTAIDFLHKNWDKKKNEGELS